jgi:leucyl-tRNA synthetase
VFCADCAEKIKSQISNLKNLNAGEKLNPGWVPLPEEGLPLILPEVEKYEPTGTGESPLAAVTDWVNTICPRCGGKAKRETNTMPQWAGSCWYYLAYLLKSQISNLKSQNLGLRYFKNIFDHWLPVDLYVGGAEHAVLHLLYARFWHKVLYDEGLVSAREPFMKLLNQGIILGEDGQKMSKSRGNVINPDEVVKEYGADTLRMYEMFMGPFSDSKPWSTKGIIGVRRFLEKVWKLGEKVKSQISNLKSTDQNLKLEKLLHKTIKKVSEDIEAFKFNTAISALMILVNAMAQESSLQVTNYKLLIKLLSPFAPHIAEELWERISSPPLLSKEGRSPSQFILQQPWPKYDPAMVVEEEIDLVIQINGRVRAMIKVSPDIAEKDALKQALKLKAVESYLKGKAPKKTVFVKGRLINIVI